MFADRLYCCTFDCEFVETLMGRFISIVMKQGHWDLWGLNSFASRLARVHGPVFACVLHAFSRTKPALTYLTPFPQGCFVAEHCDEAPVGGGVKHFWTRNRIKTAGSRSLISNYRGIFMEEKMQEAFIVCQMIGVGKRLNCAIGGWNIVLFLSFSSAKPSANITRRLTEITGKQRCNAWTGTHLFILLYRDQKVRSRSRDCRKSREIRPRRPNV